MAASKVAITRVYTGSRLGDDTQRQAQRASTALNLLPFAQGVWVKNVVITTSNTIVAHKLGRKPQGYIVTRIQGNAVPFCESLPASQPADQTKFYAFIASGASVTVDMFFF